MFLADLISRTKKKKEEVSAKNKEEK